MQKQLLLGDEAIAQGAIDAGLSGIYAYPGTPSTEITEYVQRNKEAGERNIHSLWSANEKTAMEAALGMVYSGKRAMVCMKHVGLNVAADPFMNAAITGVNGGLVVTVADDPSMHSSQNEQDSRYYGKFAMLPVFEPANQQEAYDMTRLAFELSEKLRTPVLLRITTRLAHSRSGVERKEMKEQNTMKLPEDPHQFVLLPSIARQRYKTLLQNQKNFDKAAEDSVFNQYFDGKDKKTGVIACGIAFNYLMENVENPDDLPFPLVKIGQYPLPVKMLEKLFNQCEQIMVFEEGYPIVEETLKGIFENPKIKGRLSGDIPRDGELNPNIVAKALSIEQTIGNDIPELVKKRPPAMCPGCSHIDVYIALNEAIEEYGKGRVFSDIGCYTLGAYEPYCSINSCVDMGASVTMAKGAADAGLVPAVAVIGDSTFTHSGMTGLLDAVVENSPITVIISDNSTTAMTGGQDSHAKDRLFKICIGLGVSAEHVRLMNPLKKNHEEMVRVMKEEFEYKGVSVIIPQRECIQTASRRRRRKKK